MKIDNNHWEVLKTIIYEQLLELRQTYESKHGEDNLYGTCIKASDDVYRLLKANGLSPKIVEGWCDYDDFSSCSDCSYDAHTWVECKINNETIIFDITLSQFSHYIDEEIPSVYMKTLPYYLTYDEPSNKVDEDEY